MGEIRAAAKRSPGSDHEASASQRKESKKSRVSSSRLLSLAPNKGYEVEVEQDHLICV